MATNTQIADAIAYYEDRGAGIDNCMDPVVLEVPLEDLSARDTQTVFVTSRFSMAAWPSAEIVFDLSDSATRSEITETLKAGAVALANLLDCWR